MTNNTLPTTKETLAAFLSNVLSFMSLLTDVSDDLDANLSSSLYL